MNTYPSFGAFNQQLQQVQNQLATMQATPYQQNQMQVPYPNYLQQPVAEPEQIKTVTGLDGAKAYLQKMPANSSAVLMDNNENVFYSVKKDTNGMAFPIAIGRFTLETEQEQTSSYVTKKDFDDFKAELKSLLG